MSDDNRGEYRDALADILERDAELRGAGIVLEPDPGTPRWQIVLVVVLAVAFTVVLAWDVVVLTGGDEAPPAEVREAAGIAAFAVAMEIEAFREREGRWPRELAEIGFGESGLEYEASGDGYSLRDPATGQALTGGAETDPLEVLRALDLPGGGGG